MGWISAVASIAAASQASAAGKYNQAVQERNARVAEQEAEQMEKQKEFDLTAVWTLLILYSKVAQSQKMEEANFARMRGQIARNEAKAAQIGYYAQAGQSLMKYYG